MDRILFRTISEAYYKQNLWFFLFILYVAFGIFTIQGHISIAQSAIGSPLLIALIYLLPWTLYTIKGILFVLKTISNPKNEFLYLLRLLPKKELLIRLLIVNFAILQPIIFYAAYVLKIGIENTEWLGCFILLLFLLFMVILPVSIYLKALNHPNSSQNNLKFSQLLNIRFSNRYPFFFTAFMLNDQKMVLFLTKLVTCFFIAGVCKLYSTDQYDHRLISIGLLLAAMGNASMVKFFHAFENEKLLITRNLPLSNLKRFQFQSLSFLLILIPEFLILIANLPTAIGLIYIPQGWLFLFSLVFLAHHFLYFLPGNPEESAKYLFAGFFLNLLTIMFKIPIWLPSIFYLAMAFAIFRKYYYKVEYEVDFAGL